MFRAYLKYLFRERRAVLLFLVTVFLAIVLTFTYTYGDGASPARGALFSLCAAMAMCVGMTAVLPVMTFAFVHGRRSADVYLALPVSRVQQLTAGLAFCFAVPLACFLLAAASALLAGAPASVVAACLPFAALGLAEMTVIHTCLFLLANSLFDGVVMLAAYSLLPLPAWLCAGMWVSLMVAGKEMGALGEELLLCLSPAAMVFKNFADAVRSGESVRPAYALLPAGYAAAAAFLLRRHFVRRPSERAGQVSDDPLAYPFVIHACLLLALTALSAYAVWDSARGVLIWYVLLFAAYAAAMFVYRRRLRLDLKAFAVFGGMTALSLLIAWAGWRTHAFGAADRHGLDGGDALVYEYNLDVCGDRLDEPCGSEDLYLAAPESVRHVGFVLEIPQGERERYEEAVAILERLRERETEAYYGRKKNTHFMQLEISKAENAPAGRSTSPAGDGRSRRYFDEWYYAGWAGREGVLTEEELLVIDRYTEVGVFFPYAVPSDGGDGSMTLKEYLRLRDEGLLPAPAAPGEENA